MEQEQMKKFRFKYALRDKKTRQCLGVKEEIIQGYTGNDAVYRFIDELMKEGKYDIDDSYSYIQVPEKN